jgi:hypothetical protein
VRAPGRDEHAPPSARFDVIIASRFRLAMISSADQGYGLV